MYVVTAMTRTLLASILLTATAALAGCDAFAPERRTFVIHIDSIAAPEIVPGAAAFQILFYGPLGPNTCYTFKEFLVTRGAAAADITVLGESVDGVCPQMPVALDGEPLTIAAPATGLLTVRIHQPNGTVLTRVIRAE